MPLRLITGLANAGKTGEVLKEALAAAGAGASPVIAVPNLADVRRLERELSGKAPLGVRVVTLAQLATDLWTLYGDGRRVIDGTAREAVLAGSIASGVGRELERAAETPGFGRLMSRLVAKSAVRGGRSTAVGGVGHSVDALIGRYRAALADAGLVERRWLGELLSEIAPTLEGPVGVARYDSLAANDLALLAGLAPKNQVSVALTWEHMFAPTSANDAAVEYLTRMASEHIELPEPSPTNEIQMLARSLFSGPAGVTSQHSVITALASGGEAEAALIARFVAAEVVAGVPAERIVVAFRWASRRVDALEKALLSRGVSADFDVSIPFLATQMGRAWHSLLSLAAGRGGRAEALTYFASPYSGEDPAAVHERDREWRMKRMSEPAALLASMGETGATSEGAIKRVCELAKQPLTPQNLASWQEMADAMLSSALQGRVGRGVGRAEAQDAAAHRAIEKLLAEMSQCGDRAPDLSSVLLASARIDVHESAEESPGRVQVCDFRTIGARRFDVVILGGLTEDEVSLGARDEVEDELGVEDAEGIEGEAADRLRLQFYSLVTRARSKLYLVRQEADSEGRERRASGLWEDALDAYRPVGGSVDDPAPDGPEVVRMGRAQIEELAPVLTRGRREARVAAMGLRVAVPHRGEIESPKGLLAISSAKAFSATEVETYLECPYKWFYERVVRPEEIDKASGARELGTLAHGLLAAFYREVAGLPARARVTAEWLPEALQLFEQVVSEERARHGLGGGLSEELDAARATAWARSVVGQDATFLPQFVPEFVELEFGGEPPFSFAGHAFHGRIDRIDTSPGSVFVTDYKSSSQVVGVTKFEAQAKVQAVIYACAAEGILGRPASGSVYRSIRSGRLRGFWRSDLLDGLPAGMCEDDAIEAAGFAELVQATEARVGDAIAGMRAGRVPRAPAVAGACTYCSLSAMCEGARS